MKKQAQHILKGDIILYEIILKTSIWDVQPSDTIETIKHQNEVLEDALVDGRTTVLTYKSADGSRIVAQFPSDYPFDIQETNRLPSFNLPLSEHLDFALVDGRVYLRAYDERDSLRMTRDEFVAMFTLLNDNRYEIERAIKAMQESDNHSQK